MFSIFKKIFSLSQSNNKSKKLFIIIGIGNKGHKYKNTRHNIGFSVIDAVTKQYKVTQRGNWCDCEIAICALNSDVEVVLAKPQTYVNRSGEVITKLLKRYKLQMASCLIIVDDLNLPFGVLRFRAKGTHGGHNGLLSIIAKVGNNFSRLKVGIGPLPENKNIIDFVLSPFENEEIERMREIMNMAVEGAEYFCNNGITATMNIFNKRK